jgi:hypothetical protein
LSLLVTPQKHQKREGKGLMNLPSLINMAFIRLSGEAQNSR